MSVTDRRSSSADMMMMWYAISLTLLAVVWAEVVSPGSGSRLLGELMLATRSSPLNGSWIDQPVDHFNKNDHRMWKMQIFDRHDFFIEGGPLFIFFGDNMTIMTYSESHRTIFDLANETHGGIIVAEHRYYGEILPVEFTGVESLKYLNSAQAMADMSIVIMNIKSMPVFSASKIVMVGNGYSGNLAAWFRMRYPHLADMAVASSAPVFAKPDFYEFLETVSENYYKFGTPGCWDTIKNTFQALEEAFKTERGIEKLKKDFNICGNTNLNNTENRGKFFYGRIFPFLDSIFSDVQYIKDHCNNIMADMTMGRRNHFRRGLLMLSRRYLDPSGCEIIDHYDDLQWLVLSPHERAWMYQSCSEYGHAQTTSSHKQPFGSSMLLGPFYKTCALLFGNKYSEQYINYSINHTNWWYGGLNENFSRVLFTHGELDPFRHLGVVRSIHAEFQAIVIPKMPQGMHFWADRQGDPKEWSLARNYVKYMLKRWLWPYPTPTTPLVGK